MSESKMDDTEKIKNIEKNEIFKTWLDQTIELLKTADETQLFQIKKRLDPFIRRSCSLVDCESKNTKLYYCAYCKTTNPVCSEHFKNLNSRICLVCGNCAITRRWTTPFPEI